MTKRETRQREDKDTIMTKRQTRQRRKKYKIRAKRQRHKTQDQDEGTRVKAQDKGEARQRARQGTRPLIQGN